MDYRQKDSFKSQIADLIANDNSNSISVKIIAATFAIHDDNLKDAISYLSGYESNLEV